MKLLEQIDLFADAWTLIHHAYVSPHRDGAELPAGIASERLVEVLDFLYDCEQERRKRKERDNGPTDKAHHPANVESASA